MNPNNPGESASPGEDTGPGKDAARNEEQLDWSPPSGSAHDSMMAPPLSTSDVQMASPRVDEQPTVLLDEPQTRTRSKWPVIAVAGVVLLAIGLLVADWAARNLEMSQLLTQIEKSEAAMTTTQDRIREVVIPPSGGLTPQQPDEKQLGDAAAELRRISGEGRDAVAEAGKDVAAVSFFPWHSDLVAAQGAYLDHNRAWVEYLDAGAKDAAALGRTPDNIGSTWKIAEVRVREAIPIVPFPGIVDRINKIFAEGDAESTGPTIEASLPGTGTISELA